MAKVCFCTPNRTGGVIVSVLVSGVVDRGFKPQSGQTKDYNIIMCCFPVKHTSLASISS
jgi:hypothetical protein